jgi:hypothetical protein
MRVAAIGLLAVTMATASVARAAEDDTPATPPPPAAAPGPAAAPEPAAPAPTEAPAPSTTSETPTVSGRPPKAFPKLRQASLLHKYQLGISLMPGVGFRGIFPYQENIPCGQQGKRVCTGLLPFFLDAQTSFGIAQHWDLLVDLRFGIGTDFTTSHQFAVAPGFRYWVDPELAVKFYATMQGVFDATAQHDSMVKNNDFGIRNANGMMFEVMPNFGFFIQFGETIGFVRWMRFEIDGGAGIQARIP